MPKHYLIMSNSDSPKSKGTESSPCFPLPPRRLYLRRLNLNSSNLPPQHHSHPVAMTRRKDRQFWKTVVQQKQFQGKVGLNRSLLYNFIFVTPFQMSLVTHPNQPAAVTKLNKPSPLTDAFLPLPKQNPPRQLPSHSTEAFCDASHNTLCSRTV